jgi:DNA-binding NtrC family response regulator
MQAVIVGVNKAAAVQTGVLLCGEAGTGRRMVARELHHLSPGPDAPFVAVDCAEVEELEATLFGASTTPSNGGPDHRQGLDRISTTSVLCGAVGGTLFLAHLPEMPTRVQARLARILRDGEVTIQEGKRTLPLRVRLIASSEPDWKTAVAEGRIRADLCKRCSASRIDLPPLRNRREDIPLLATAFLEEACAASHLEPKEIDPPAMALLSALPWRGNVREMQALIHSLAAVLPGTFLRLEDLLGSVHLDDSARTFVAAGTLRQAKERFERDYIVAVLERHRGRIGEAARALGIQRPNLYRKMRTLRLPLPRHA